MKTNILKIKDINLSYFLRSLFVLIGYFVSGKLGLMLAFVNTSATAIWPPTGIALAALILGGYRYYPVIFLGAFLVNISTSGSVTTSLGIALGNTIEALLGAYLVNKYALGKHTFHKLTGVIKFTFLGAFLATTTSATIGTLSLFLTDNAALSSLNSVWITWWLGDASGALIITPLIVLWATNRRPWRRDEALEALAVFSILFIVGQIVFSGFFPFSYICIPVLVWAALRLTPREVSVGVCFLALIALTRTLNYQGPFAFFDTNYSLLMLQCFIGTTSVMSLIMAAIVRERQEGQERIIEEQAEDQALLASIGDGIIATDKEGKIILVNKTFENILGWKEKEILGRKPFEFLKVEDEKGNSVLYEKRPLNIAIEQRKKVTVTHYLSKKDGSKFPASIVANPVLLGGKLIGAIEIIHNITREKEIDKAKTEFVSLASHQLKTPLSTINWYTELLMQRASGLDEKQKEYLTEIFQASKRMDILINTLLTVSRLEMQTFRLVPEKMDLLSIFKETLSDFKIVIKEKELKVVENYLIPEKTVALLHSDPKLIQVVLQNIFSNAIRYTKNKGKIEITVKKKGSDKLLIIVKDNGIGIPKEEQKKIFSKLFRASNVKLVDQQGTGLGLYIVKLIIERINGDIKFVSDENRGTTFYITLPINRK